MKSYLITDPKYFSNDTSIFETTLTNILKTKEIDYICFRDKVSKNYELLAKRFVDISKSNNISNIFINSHIDLAYSLNATGVHLTSTQFDKIAYAKSMKLKVIVSTHNIEDINKAIKYKADYITYSPIFDTPNKGAAKGIDDLKYITNKYKDIKIFALGGIVTNNHIDMIKTTSSYGFASIRYFVK